MTTQNSPLDQMVAATLEQHEAAQQQKAREQERLNQQHRQQREQEIAAAFERDFSPEFRASLPPAPYTFDHSNYNNSSLVFPYTGWQWHLELYASNWSFWATQPGEGRQYKSESSLPSTHVQQALLLAIARCKGHEDTNAQYRREREETEAQAKAERQQRATEARIQDQAIAARVEALRQDAQRQAWRWPEGACITLYHLEYCRGGVSGEEGDYSTDYASGWTTSPFLGNDGKVTLMPYKPYKWSRSPERARVLSLSLMAHKPVWEQHDFASTDELPVSLREKVLVPVKGVRKQYNHDAQQDLFANGEEARGESDCYTIELAEQPLSWIRDLLKNL